MIKDCYRATIEGSKTKASRVGGAKTGISGTFLAPFVGVEIHIKKANGLDTIFIYKLKGIERKKYLIAQFSE